MAGEPAHYIHGYAETKADRLSAQALSVLDLLHVDTRYPAGHVVLEVGCGTGQQTCTLLRNSPETQFVSFDRSALSLARAKARADQASLRNARFLEADLFRLPFEPQSFDHDPCIGRETYPLLRRAGYSRVLVEPRTVYVDGSRPALIESFTRKTFTGMIEGVRNEAIAARLMSAPAFDQGVRDLLRTANEAGVFCDTFFKGVGFNDEPAG